MTNYLGTFGTREAKPPARPVLSWNDCCRAVLKECPDPYAKTYANAGLGMIGEERRVQALYLVGNITYWRDGRSKEVRTAIKLYGLKGMED